MLPRLLAWGGWAPPLANLCLPFPAPKGLVVANSGEGHLEGVAGECHHPKARQEELTEVGNVPLAYHGVQWDNGGRHEGVEKVVYTLPENEPRGIHMLTHLQQSNTHPFATSFVRALLCFATSPTVLVMQGSVPPQPLLHHVHGTAGLCRAHLPLCSCTWLNPKWRGHLAPSAWRTQGGRHLGEETNSSQAAPCKVSSCPQVQRDVPLLSHVPSHLTYLGHCGTGPLIHQRPDNLQSPGRNIWGLIGIKDPYIQQKCSHGCLASVAVPIDHSFRAGVLFQAPLKAVLREIEGIAFPSCLDPSPT